MIIDVDLYFIYSRVSFLKIYKINISIITRLVHDDIFIKYIWPSIVCDKNYMI